MPAFRLPDLGEGLTEAEVVSWLVQEGDTVEIDQPVVEVETAKATVEVPVPFAGVVTRCYGAPGDVIAVGAPLLEVAAAGVDDEPFARSAEPVARSADPADGFREPGTVTPDSARLSVIAGQGDEPSGNVLIGYGTSTVARRRRSARRRVGGHAATADRESGSTPSPGLPMPLPTATAVISPLVRRLARDSGLDLASIAANGNGRVILRRDVERAIAGTRGGEAPLAEEADPVRASATRHQDHDDDSGPGQHRIPLRGLRKVVADKLSRSRREIPEATVWVDVDATGLLLARATMNRSQPARPVSLLSLLSRFAIVGLRRYPELNARVDQDAITLYDAVHLGFATQTDRGLLVPVVRDAHRMTTRDLAAALAERTERARAGDLTPAELSGGSFTVNNYGVFGVDGSAAIINHPEVAIFGIGRIIDRPWVVDGRLEVRRVTQLTLAFDHRVCDGATAGGFLRFVADCVEAPVHALGDM